MPQTAAKLLTLVVTNSHVSYSNEYFYCYSIIEMTNKSSLIDAPIEADFEKSLKEKTTPFL